MTSFREPLFELPMRITSQTTHRLPDRESGSVLCGLFSQAAPPRQESYLHVSYAWFGLHRNIAVNAHTNMAGR